MTRRCCWPSRRGCRCGAIGWVNGWATAVTARCTAASIPGVDRELAIKVIGQGLADRPGFVRSFESTVQRVSSLCHPGIVDIQDYWREPGAAYVVMRRLHGGTLTDRLDRGPMTTAEVANLVARVGGALVSAGEAGVRHGGVSAHNVLFDDAGEPCLADFAIVPSPAPPPPMTSVTSP